MDSALNELFSDSNKIQNEQDLQMEIDKDFYEENNNENSNGLYFPLTIHKNEIDGNDIILEQPSKEEEVSLTPTKESYISNKLKNFESNKKLNNLINSNRKIDNISQYSKNNKNLINTDNVEINLNNNNFFNFNKKQKDSIIKINGEQNSNTNNLFLNTKSQNINLLLKDITTYKNHSEYDTKNSENLNNSITNKNLIYKEGNILNISKNYLEDNHTTNNNFFENNCENVKNSKDFNNINISLKNFLNKDKENYNYQKNICKKILFSNNILEKTNNLNESSSDDNSGKKNCDGKNKNDSFNHIDSYSKSTKIKIDLSSSFSNILKEDIKISHKNSKDITPFLIKKNLDSKEHSHVDNKLTDSKIKKNINEEIKVVELNNLDKIPSVQNKNNLNSNKINDNKNNTKKTIDSCKNKNSENNSFKILKFENIQNQQNSLLTNNIITKSNKSDNSNNLDSNKNLKNKNETIKEIVKHSSIHIDKKEINPNNIQCKKPPMKKFENIYDEFKVLSLIPQNNESNYQNKNIYNAGNFDQNNHHNKNKIQDLYLKIEKFNLEKFLKSSSKENSLSNFENISELKNKENKESKKELEKKIIENISKEKQILPISKIEENLTIPVNFKPNDSIHNRNFDIQEIFLKENFSKTQNFDNTQIVDIENRVVLNMCVYELTDESPHSSDCNSLSDDDINYLETPHFNCLKKKKKIYPNWVQDYNYIKSKVTDQYINKINEKVFGKNKIENLDVNKVFYMYIPELEIRGESADWKLDNTRSSRRNNGKSKIEVIDENIYKEKNNWSEILSSFKQTKRNLFNDFNVDKINNSRKKGK